MCVDRSLCQRMAVSRFQHVCSCCQVPMLSIQAHTSLEICVCSPWDPMGTRLCAEHLDRVFGRLALYMCIVRSSCIHLHASSFQLVRLSTVR